MEEMQKGPQSGKPWNDDFARKFQKLRKINTSLV